LVYHFRPAMNCQLIITHSIPISEPNTYLTPTPLPLTTHHSPLTTHTSPLTTHHLTTHHLTCLPHKPSWLLIAINVSSAIKTITTNPITIHFPTLNSRTCTSPPFTLGIRYKITRRFNT